jgi:hypothetical protein
VGTVARHAKLLPDENTPAAVARTDVLSFALARLEDALAKAGAGLRAGWLRLERLRLVDVFGQERALVEKSQPVGGLQVRRAAADEAVLQAAAPAHALLRPRLPYWARVQLRFTAPEPDGATPVRGYLLPDLVEHGLEVFDRDGEGLGQLRHRRAADGSTEVRWEAHPWAPVADAAAGEGAPGRVVADAGLRALLEGVLAQPPSPSGESALAAMLRTMDTTRLSVQRRSARSGPLGRITGRPIAVVGAELRLETAGTATDPVAQPSPAAVPAGVAARLGSLAQLDDGLLGYVLAAEPGVFRPVDAAVRQVAVASGPYSGLQGDGGKAETRPVDHPYVSDQDRVALAAGQTVGVLLLMDPYGGLHVTTGVLPRKRLALPEAHVEAVDRIAPSFAVAPVLGRPDAPALPLPVVADRAWEWVRAAEGGGWTQQPVEAATTAASVDPRPALVPGGVAAADARAGGLTAAPTGGPAGTPNAGGRRAPPGRPGHVRPGTFTRALSPEPNPTAASPGQPSAMSRTAPSCLYCCGLGGRRNDSSAIFFDTSHR